MADTVYLVRLEDDHSLTPISEHSSLTEALAEGYRIVEVDYFDYSCQVYSADGVRLSRIKPNRACYREWAIRNGWISSLDDRYEHDEDELVAH